MSLGRTLEKLGAALNSPECVEGEFYELRPYRVPEDCICGVVQRFCIFSAMMHWPPRPSMSGWLTPCSAHSSSRVARRTLFTRSRVRAPGVLTLSAGVLA